MQATENLDALYLITLMSELGKISDALHGERDTIAIRTAKARLDQLRVRIGKDVRAMQESEAGFTNG